MEEQEVNWKMGSLTLQTKGLWRVRVRLGSWKQYQIKELEDDGVTKFDLRF